MQTGILALRDLTRALRGRGAARKGEGTEVERSALIELAALEGRLSGYIDDQREDDWADFWLTERDVDALRHHLAAVATEQRGLSPATLPALRALAEEMASFAQRIH